ncbi:HipA domain-containing protein [Pseudomonas sp. 2FE]|uniref:HipA domain-containing protein n=1 Tax=Pseudomonas sp. 2FE TaxID=2502190 RepID=UPI0010F97E24|nr:HipA domain-containing protein [Pseudomonas sp. 2FE]
MARQLNAWINGTLVGTLAEENGLWTFTYSAQWLTAPERYPLCPSLPLQPDTHVDGATDRPVQWYFDNLLPEEGQRQLIARAAKIGTEDAFGLLAHFGAESAGSITLLPPDQQQIAGELIPLPDEELSRRIRNMPQVPLAQAARKHMSLAGAQHKVAIVLDGDQLMEPSGSAPSTHILKPDHPAEAYAHSVINEWFVMTLANRVGLNVPAVSRRYVPEPVYLIERFDRRHGPHGWERLHSIDACQLLGLDKAYKYSSGSIERLEALSRLCSIPAKARLALYQWLGFNVLVGNTDAHLKNLSFMMKPSGVALAPFYDLLSTAVYDTRSFDKDLWPQAVELAWPIGDESRIANLNRQQLLAAGEALGIKQATAGSQLAKLVKGVREHSQAMLGEVEQANRAIAEQRPELRATLAGEMRCLRAIVTIVIAEMSEQLS